MVLAVAGLLVQLTGVLVDYETINEGLTTSVMNDTQTSQAWLGAQALSRALAGERVYPRVTTALAGRTVDAPVDLWWARPHGGGLTSAVFDLLAAALLAVAVYAGIRLHTALRIRASPATPAAVDRARSDHLADGAPV